MSAARANTDSRTALDSDARACPYECADGHTRAFANARSADGHRDSRPANGDACATHAYRYTGAAHGHADARAHGYPCSHADARANGDARPHARARCNL